jgi:hypothetical protein
VWSEFDREQGDEGDVDDDEEDRGNQDTNERFDVQVPPADNVVSNFAGKDVAPFQEIAPES